MCQAAETPPLKIKHLDAIETLNSHDDERELPQEFLLRAFANRLLQSLARFMPGAFTFRVWAHRKRGVKLGSRVHIASDVMIETAYPQWVSIGNNVQIGLRCLILAHIHSLPPRKREAKDYVSVRIEDDSYIGPASVVLPNVRIGRGAVVAAGSVVTRSVPAMTMVRGNPAVPIAHCGVPLTWDTPIKVFYLNLKPIEEKQGLKKGSGPPPEDSDPHA